LSAPVSVCAGLIEPYIEEVAEQDDAGLTPERRAQLEAQLEATRTQMANLADQLQRAGQRERELAAQTGQSLEDLDTWETVADQVNETWEFLSPFAGRPVAAASPTDEDPQRAWAVPALVRAEQLRQDARQHLRGADLRTVDQLVRDATLAATATRRRPSARWLAWWRGSDVEWAWRCLHLAEEELVARLDPDDLDDRLGSIYEIARRYLPSGDPGLTALHVQLVRRTAPSQEPGPPPQPGARTTPSKPQASPGERRRTT
jgi:hypothetical protein